MEELDVSRREQLMNLCLKTLSQEEAVDANTLMALLGLVNLTGILDLLGPRSVGAEAPGKLPLPKELASLANLIPQGTDQGALLSNVMGMLGGKGDLSKLLPLVSMLGNAFNNNNKEEPAVKEEVPPTTEEYPAPTEEYAPPQAPKDEQQEPPGSGWARVGR